MQCDLATTSVRIGYNQVCVVGVVLFVGFGLRGRERVLHGAKANRKRCVRMEM